MPGQGTVKYLVDFCAPCQDIASAYAIDGIVLSDFCTPGFFGGPAAWGAGRSFTGAVRDVLTPAANGLLIWLADDGLLYQAHADESGRVKLRGGFSLANRGRMTMRELVQMLTPDRLERLSNASPTAALIAAQENASRVRLANMIRYREDIAWRFGHATRPLPEPMPRVKVARHISDGLAAHAGGIARSGHPLASSELHTTARANF